MRSLRVELADHHGSPLARFTLLLLALALGTLALAGRLVSRAPDITRMLDKLEERDLISRDRPAENRRVVRVGITAAGQDLLRELDVRVRACHARQLGHLSPADLRNLVALLRAARPGA